MWLTRLIYTLMIGLIIVGLIPELGWNIRLTALGIDWIIVAIILLGGLRLRTDVENDILTHNRKQLTQIDDLPDSSADSFCESRYSGLEMSQLVMQTQVGASESTTDFT